MKPTVGRIVHYVEVLGLPHKAAIIVRLPIVGDKMSLYVFPTPSDEGEALPDVQYEENPAAQTWHWPEREDE